MENNKFIIYSAGYNCEKYIKLHMEMVQKQTYKNYKHIIVDDASTDNTYNTIKSMSNEKTVLFKNEENSGWLYNSVQYLVPDPEDIVIVLDLDDWFFHNNVLEIINKVYNENNCWLTYGSFIWLKENLLEGQEYPKDVIENNKFRDSKWLAAPPRTFKGFLWNKIDKSNFYIEELKDCYDQAIMLPMLEMCPVDKMRFISDTLYVYNTYNPLLTKNIKKQEQAKAAKYIRNLPRYNKIVL